MANGLALPVIVIASLGLVSPAFGQRFKLPEGDGKDKVAGICGNCHSISRLAAGYTPEGWRTVVRMMLNFRVPIPTDQLTPITNYLINAFPEPSRPAAVVIPGPTEINIKE